MRYRSGVLLLLVLGVAVYSASQVARRASPLAEPVADEAVAFRVTFGSLRQAPKKFDGSLTVAGGKLIKLSPWRFFQQDRVREDGSWKLDIKRAVLENQPDKPNPVAGGSAPAQNLVPAGLFVAVTRGATAVEFRTAQGDFSAPLSRLAYGRVLSYLDGDVLVERTPAVVQLSPADKQEHDYPSLAVTRSGAVWTAWQAYEDRGDHVYARSGSAPAVRLTAQKADVFRTAIGEDASGAIHVVWSERQGEDWRLIERIGKGADWTAVRAIVTGSSPNIFHKLIAGPAALHLVWVGHEGGQSFLYAARYEGGNWTAPARLGGPSVWSPDAALDRQGSLYVAWDSYQNGNYDIFVRRIPAGGAPEPVEQVTRSPRFQAHPSLAIDAQDRVWLAWDESGANWGKDWNHEDQNRGTTLYADRSIKVVVKDGGAWKQVGDFATAVSERLRRYWQLPKLAVDGAGRVWAMFQIRTAAANNRDDFWCNAGLWDLFLTTFENGVWRPATMLPKSTARPEAPFQIAGARDRVWMAWATDGREFRGAGAGASMVHYDTFLAQAAESAPAGPLANLWAFDEASARAPQIMHPAEVSDVQRIRAYRTTAGGVTYRILRGDFHRHTEISQDGAGDGSVEDYYRYMLDAARMDTGIIGDHNAGSDIEYNWWRTEKSYDVFKIRGRFTPLFGYERSVNFPNGHRNVVFPERGVRTLPVQPREQKGAVNSGSIVYPYLRQHRGICMEHSLATNQGTDYRDNDPSLEPLVEIYQGYHTSYEYKGAPRAENDNRHTVIHGGYQPEGFWWNALAKGLRLGVQSSSDHISTHCSYAMIYTPDAGRSTIVESMRKRHAYAATDNIVLDFQADGHLQGEEFTGRPKLRVRVLGTDLIAQIDVVRNNQFIHTERPLARDFGFDYEDRSPQPGVNYYYVRVMQQDGNLAWSSPVWIRP
jgi:hypothetical protein